MSLESFSKESEATMKLKTLSGQNDCIASLVGFHSKNLVRKQAIWLLSAWGSIAPLLLITPLCLFFAAHTKNCISAFSRSPLRLAEEANQVRRSGARCPPMRRTDRSPLACVFVSTSHFTHITGRSRVPCANVVSRAKFPPRPASLQWKSSGSWSSQLVDKTQFHTRSNV